MSYSETESPLISPMIATLTTKVRHPLKEMSASEIELPDVEVVPPKEEADAEGEVDAEESFFRNRQVNSTHSNPPYKIFSPHTHTHSLFLTNSHTLLLPLFLLD
jgi:hypothetical protein